MANDDSGTRLPPFTVTRAAVDQIEALGGAVRVDVEDGGCCGRTYVYEVLDSTEARRDGDTAYGCPGAWLLVGDQASAVLRGATLDYAGRLKPPRFRVISNPNTKDTCPCRRSFGTPWPGPGQAACQSYRPMPWDEAYEPPDRWKRQTGYERDANN